jgi:alkylhydroperoxidase/carboxymuconolactone decarboxylase family protein YurZ
MSDYEEKLRRLAIHHEQSLDSAVGGQAADDGSTLSPRELGLVRMAATVALDAPASSFGWAATRATAAGASAEDMVAVLEAVAPIVGSAIVVSASPKLAQAVGYDLDRDLEDPASRRP